MTGLILLFIAGLKIYQADICQASSLPDKPCRFSFTSDVSLLGIPAILPISILIQSKCVLNTKYCLFCFSFYVCVKH